MKKYLYLFYILFLILGSCGKDDPASDISLVKDKITGYVQKGPFVSGTTVLMNELNPSLVQPGKYFPQPSLMTWDYLLSTILI